MPASTTPASRLLLRAALFGFANGLRTVLPSAVLARSLRQRQPVLPDPVERLYLLPQAKPALRLGVGVETVLDKLPATPSRLTPAGMAFRLLGGALGGAALGRSLGGSTWLCAAVGLASAGAGAVAGYQARTTVRRALNLPDWPVALVEDGATFLLASLAVRQAA